MKMMYALKFRKIYSLYIRSMLVAVANGIGGNINLDNIEIIKW
jgi:hypothetical protein